MRRPPRRAAANVACTAWAGWSAWTRGTAWAACVALSCLVAARSALAHSASDAYLTVTAEKSPAGAVTLHGQWDIALRDLDFVLKLDADGDGQITWREVRLRQGDIERYAYRYLKLNAAGGACNVKPVRQMIDEHADGAYAALFFDAACPRSARKVSLQYTLFFKIDPSHRGIFVMHDDANVATALLSPENATIDLGP